MHINSFIRRVTDNKVLLKDYNFTLLDDPKTASTPTEIDCNPLTPEELVEEQKRLQEPSGLKRVMMPLDGWMSKTIILDFTGTTKQQAIEKVLTFYKIKKNRRGLGDHIFFEGFHPTKEDDLHIIFTGS